MTQPPLPGGGTGGPGRAGTRGWLLFWIVAVVIGSAGALSVPVPWAAGLDGGVVPWEMPAGWTPLMVLLGLAGLATAYLLLALRSPLAVLAARTFLALQVVPGILLLALPPHLPAGYAPAPGSSWMPELYLLVGLIDNAIWQPYFLRSRRVRATYAGTAPWRPWAGLGQLACVLAGIACAGVLGIQVQDLAKMGSLRETRVILRVKGEGTKPATGDEVERTLRRIARRCDAAALPVADVSRVEGSRDRIEVALVSSRPLPSGLIPDILTRRGRLEFLRVEGEPFEHEEEARVASEGRNVRLLADRKTGKFYLCAREPVLGGGSVVSAAYHRDHDGAGVSLEFSEAAGERLRDYTWDHPNERIAVVFDGSVLSAPVIRGVMGPRVEIRGAFTDREGLEVSRLLRLGPPLPRPVEVVERRMAPVRGGWISRRIVVDVLLAAGALALLAGAAILFVWTDRRGRREAPGMPAAA